MSSRSARAEKLQDPKKVLASILQASTPEVAFTNLARPGSRLVANKQSRVGLANPAIRVPTMHHIDGQNHMPMDIEQQAADCLKQGCPADTVEDLLRALKQDEQSSTELAETIVELEKLLVEPKANKNAIEKLVASLASSYTMPSEVMGAFGEALSSRRGSTKMSADEDYEQLAARCLEEGCPVDTVQELLAALKADEREPTAELTEIISELEKLLPTDNKNEISKWVETAFSILVQPYGEFGDTYPKGGDFNVIQPYKAYSAYKPGKSRQASLKMAADEDYEQIAAKCLEEGCPVDTVEELLAALKADEREPTAELTEIISELEKLLPTDNKNEISKWVEAAWSILRNPSGEKYTGPPEKAAAPPAPRTDLETPINVAKLHKYYRPKYAKYISPESRQKLKELGITPKWAEEKTPADEDYEKLASKCLEEGCSVDTVEELLAALKADEREPTAELKELISEMQKLLVQPEKNKNEISKWVETAFSILVQPYGEFGETYPKGGDFNVIEPYKAYKAYKSK